MTAVEFFLIIFGVTAGLVGFSLWAARRITEWWIND